jgi:hypothetical protein
VVIRSSQIMGAGRSGRIGVAASGGSTMLEDTTVSDFQMLGVSAGMGGTVVMRGGAVRNHNAMELGTGLIGLGRAWRKRRG